MMVLELSMKNTSLVNQTLLGEFMPSCCQPILRCFFSEYDNDDSVLVQDDEDEHEVTDDGKFKSYNIFICPFTFSFQIDLYFLNFIAF